MPPTTVAKTEPPPTVPPTTPPVVKALVYTGSRSSSLALLGFGLVLIGFFLAFTGRKAARHGLGIRL